MTSRDLTVEKILLSPLKSLSQSGNNEAKEISDPELGPNLPNAPDHLDPLPKQSPAAQSSCLVSFHSFIAQSIISAHLRPCCKRSKMSRSPPSNTFRDLAIAIRARLSTVQQCCSVPKNKSLGGGVREGW